MNFYKHHIGDYDANTAHLSWTEDAAYRRLISLYYRREEPIPLDLAQACRLVRATSKQERDAVEAVLEEFFQREADGWHSKRCDEEIGLAKAKADANRTNGRGGGRPRKTVTQPEPTKNPTETQMVSGADEVGNLSQTPVTSNHLTPPSPRAVDNSARLPERADPEVDADGVPWRWWKTPQGWQAKAQALGLPAWDRAAFDTGQGIAYPVWQAFVAEQAGEGPWRSDPSSTVMQAVESVLRKAVH